MTLMNEELANCSRGRVLWLLFWNFFKIALFVVGGGFAIILAAEESFVKRLRWLKEGELLDMLTVIQSVPGLTAGNAAIYVGYRAAGHAGALIALFGVALPSFTVITLLSMGLDFLPLDNLYLQSAFIGVRTAMAGLMIATVARLWRKIMSGFFPWFVMLACFLLMTFTKVNPGWLIAGSMAAGIASAFMPRAEESRGVATLLLLFVLFVYFGLLCFGGGAVRAAPLADAGRTGRHGRDLPGHAGADRREYRHLHRLPPGGDSGRGHCHYRTAVSLLLADDGRAEIP